MIAALSAWHEHHELAAESLESVTAIPAHVAVEAYAVLTRLPAGFAVRAAQAADVLARRFPDPPLCLDEAGRAGLLSTLASAGVFGGSSYDGLVALEASAHRRVLLTLDERARPTYTRLGVRFEAITS